MAFFRRVDQYLTKLQLITLRSLNQLKRLSFSAKKRENKCDKKQLIDDTTLPNKAFDMISSLSFLLSLVHEEGSLPLPFSNVSCLKPLFR